MRYVGILLLLFCTPSCAFVCGTACDGTTAVKSLTSAGLGFVPIVGPVASSLTDVCFEVLCTTICLPSTLGTEVENTIGVSLDPTAPTRVADPDLDGIR